MKRSARRLLIVIKALRLGVGVYRLGLFHVVIIIRPYVRVNSCGLVNLTGIKESTGVVRSRTRDRLFCADIMSICKSAALGRVLFGRSVLVSKLLRSGLTECIGRSSVLSLYFLRSGLTECISRSAVLSLYFLRSGLTECISRSAVLSLYFLRSGLGESIARSSVLVNHLIRAALSIIYLSRSVVRLVLQRFRSGPYINSVLIFIIVIKRIIISIKSLGYTVEVMLIISEEALPVLLEYSYNSVPYILVVSDLNRERSIIKERVAIIFKKTISK